MNGLTKEKKLKLLGYVSMVIAALSALMPFFKWIKVPVAQGLYSLFGMDSSDAAFSLFGYIFSNSNYQSDAVFYVSFVLALVALVGIIFNVVYVVKSLGNNEKRFKFGTLGAIIMNIVSLLFIMIVGTSAAVFKVIKLTYAPYITLALTIANLVVIKMIKKEKKNEE